MSAGRAILMGQQWNAGRGVCSLGLGRLPLGSGRRLLRRGLFRWLLACDRHQHFVLPGHRFARLFTWLLGCLCRGSHFSSNALAQRVHQVDDVLASRARFRRGGFAGALLVDEINEGSFVLVFELVRLEVTLLLIDDVLGEIKHVLGDFDVLDIVEIFLRGPDLVGIAQQGPNQPLVQRLQRDDVLAISQHHTTDRDLVHFADGLADNGERVVPDFAIWSQVVRADRLAS